MQCDLLVVRHAQSGAPNLLAQKVDAAVINAGDGTHEHPTQALLDALTIRRRRGRLEGLVVAICGDIAAFPRRAVEHPSAHHDGQPRPRDRPADPDPRRGRAAWASRCSTTWRRGSPAPTW